MRAYQYNLVDELIVDNFAGGGEYDKNGIWKPNKEGLGMKHVFDKLNKIYGEAFIKY